MYEFLLFFHSWFRWVVLIVAVVAVARSFIGWFGSQRYTQLDSRLGLAFTTVIDIQVTLGIVLFIVSPFIAGLMGNVSAAMQQSSLRFFLVEHTVVMIVALIVAHVGSVLARRQRSDRRKFIFSSLFFLAATLLMFLSIPWPWMQAARPLFRI